MPETERNEMIYLVGIGPGSDGAMTRETYEALEKADVIIGAKRLLESVKCNPDAEKCAAVMPKDILAIIKEKQAAGASCFTVAMSGDTGFYSGTKGLVPVLRDAGLEYEVMPGISSVQVMSSRLAEPWQDWNLCSAHGKTIDAVAAVMSGMKTFFLTGGEIGPADIARQLKDAGLGSLRMWIGENLSYDNEKITETTAEEAAHMDPDTLAVVLTDKMPEPEVIASVPGIPDSKFVRGNIPMTKQDVRSAALGRLGVRPGDVCWDVGAGTGSVTVEMALLSHGGKTYAVETEPEGAQLIRTNKERFGAWNIDVIEGMAPEALKDLPAPDAVFIGGTKGQMGPILDVVKEKNPDARVVITAIAVETIGEAIKELADRGWNTDIAEIQSSYGRNVGRLNLMMANNPIFIITGGCDA